MDFLAQATGSIAGQLPRCSEGYLIEPEFRKVDGFLVSHGRSGAEIRLSNEFGRSFLVERAPNQYDWFHSLVGRMTGETARLHRSFAELWTESSQGDRPEAVRAFANKFGLLGLRPKLERAGTLDFPEWRPDSGDPAFPLCESIADWEAHARTAAEIVWLMDLCASRPEDLDSVFFVQMLRGKEEGRRDARVYASFGWVDNELRGLAGLAPSDPVLNRVDWPNSLQCYGLNDWWQGEYDQGEPYRVDAELLLDTTDMSPETKAQFKWVFAGQVNFENIARLYILQQINQGLEGNVSARIHQGVARMPSQRSRQELLTFPFNLLGAVYLHFAMEFQNGTPTQTQCPRCKKWFTPAVPSKTFCGQNCRKRFSENKIRARSRAERNRTESL